MKKNLLCVIVLFIVLFSSGCTSVSNDKKDEYYAPLKDTYYFNSYEELETFLSPNQLMKEFTEDNLEFYGENFKNVVSKIVNGKLKYMIPILDEKECTLQKNESQPKIALFTCELYNEPWIWYNVTVNNVDVSIRVMLSDKLDNTKDSENASQVLKSFAPSAPNVDNKDKYYCTDLCARVYGKEAGLDYNLEWNGFATSTQDIVLSKDTYISYIKIMKDDKYYIYYLANRGE